MKKPTGIKPWMLKREIAILYYAYRDLRTPFYAKIPALISLVYLLSPIDLIPDFIPFVGYLDDLVIVPFLLSLSVRLLPEEVKVDSIIKAGKQARKLELFFAGLIMLIILLLGSIFFGVRHFVQMQHWMT